MAPAPADMRNAVVLTIGVLVPYVLRLTQPLMTRRGGCLCQCRASIRRGEADALTAPAGAVQRSGGAPGPTMEQVWDRAMTWGDAVRKMGMRRECAIALAVVRLLCWHWLQPLMYAITLYAYGDQIDHTQLVLGSIVAAREVLYALLVLVALVVNPVFLLMDLRATWYVYSEQPLLRVLCVTAYGFAPSKVMWMTVIPRDSHPTVVAVGNGLTTLLDMCSIGALVAGLVKHRLPLALGVGYVVTAGCIAGIVVFVVAGATEAFCRDKVCVKSVEADLDGYVSEGSTGDPESEARALIAAARRFRQAHGTEGGGSGV